MSESEQLEKRDHSFFSPSTGKGRLRQSVLELYEQHKAEGLLPTNGRFLYYELVAAGVVSKEKTGARNPSQGVTDALIELRERGYIPWEDITDETRDVIENYHRPTLKESVESNIKYATISLWHPEPPPLVLCESRSIRSAIEAVTTEYQVPLAATNGQCAGFLRTKVKNVLEPGQVVLYMGDLDFSGGHIEANNRRVLEEVTESVLAWERVAITDEQVDLYDLVRIPKEDKRTGESYESVETEALGQARIVSLLRGRLQELMPDARRERVLERERKERKSLTRLLAGLKGKQR
jgi:hypothetical protein